MNISLFYLSGILVIGRPLNYGLSRTKTWIGSQTNANIRIGQRCLASRGSRPSPPCSAPSCVMEMNFGCPWTSERANSWLKMCCLRFRNSATTITHKGALACSVFRDWNGFWSRNLLNCARARPKSAIHKRIFHFQSRSATESTRTEFRDRK